MEGNLVEECQMGSGSEELIEDLCSCADSLEEIEGEGDRQEDVSRDVESNLCGNDWIDLCELGAPDVADNKEETELLKQEIMSDPTLQTCRSLANRKERGYYWASGLLFQRQMVHDQEFKERLVVPKSKRSMILK